MMVEHLLVLVLCSKKIHGVFGCIVATVEKPLAKPIGPGILQPSDMIRKQPARCCFRDKNLALVRATTGNTVGEVLPIL